MIALTSTFFGMFHFLACHDTVLNNHFYFLYIKNVSDGQKSVRR